MNIKRYKIETNNAMYENFEEKEMIRFAIDLVKSFYEFSCHEELDKDIVSGLRIELNEFAQGTEKRYEEVFECSNEENVYFMLDITKEIFKVDKSRLFGPSRSTTKKASGSGVKKNTSKKTSRKT